MAVFYINNLTGSDEHGSGLSFSPYKTISKGISLTLPGDQIIIQGIDTTTHHEPGPLIIENIHDIRIRAEPEKTVTMRPMNITPENPASIVISNADRITISGLYFANASQISGHKHAILVKNSSNIKITSCGISPDWKCNFTDKTELFKFENSGVEATSIFCNFISNSYPSLFNPNNYLSFISLAGNGDYLIQNCAIRNVHSNSGYAYGIFVYPDTSRFVVDDFMASNFIADHVDYKDKMIGIKINSDASPPIFQIKNYIADKLGYGLVAENLPFDSKNYIKRAMITNCLYSGILFDRAQITDNRGLTIANCLEGIHLKNSSIGEFYNTILFKCKIAARSEVDSTLRLFYSVHYQCSQLKFTNSRGQVDFSQFVRNIDPKFINEYESNFNLTDYSPCVDTGKYFDGDIYLGNGPDIGFHEKTALVTEDDLPALLAKASRLGRVVPLTEIDIIGMVAKGIETSDGRILATREGSVVKDVAVKPLDLLIRPFHTELEDIRDKLAFDRIEQLSEDDADLLASNVFVQRDYGTYSSGVIRIFFSEPSDAIIYAEHEFVSNNNLRFYNRATTAITRDEMSLNYDNGAYFFDVVVDAAVPSLNYNLPAGAIVTSTMPMPPGTLSFTNPYTLTGGLSSESNTELKERAKYNITVRDLVTKKGVKAILPSMFPVISELRTIGYRDPEMERDYIKIISDHIGGKSDLYIKTREPAQDSRIVYPRNRDFIITNASFAGFVPILKINSIEMLDPSENETGIFLQEIADWQLISLNSWFRFSAKEEIAIRFSEKVFRGYMPFTPFKINFTWIPEMKVMQSTVDGDIERVVVADFLVRAFEPAYVSFSMAYLALEELPDLGTALRGFIRVVKSGHELQVSDLVHVAYAAGVQKVIQPMQISIKHFKRNGDIVITESPDGIFIPRIAAYWDDDIITSYMGKETWV